MTAVYACVDPASGVLTYASAGHPPPLLRRAAGGVRRLEQRDLVLGFTPDVRYSAAQVQLEPGDVILLYTDGISEVEGPGGEFFGERRLEQWLASEDASASPKDIADCLLREIDAWKIAPGSEFADDVTLMVLRVTSDVASTAPDVTAGR